MNFFISDAMAAAGGPAQSNPLMSLLPLIIIFVVFYFLLIRPQSKRAKEHRKMIEALAVGDEIVTGGGIAGRVTKVGEQYASVEIANGVEIKVQKHAVGAVLPKGTLKTL
ncbi:MAG TPA: preprotein translocase subunit YajC [Gammaproteobacteria bacterium]|nr:preprotein translocase subunit YajC [Gammaproteobacteria bacterium]